MLQQKKKELEQPFGMISQTTHFLMSHKSTTMPRELLKTHTTQQATPRQRIRKTCSTAKPQMNSSIYSTLQFD